MSNSPSRAGFAVPFLRERELLGAGEGARETELAGGVSGVTVLVTGDLGERWVVKRILGELTVADEWRASTDRVLTEAHAMQLLHRISPLSTPTLLAVDRESAVLAMTAAPETYGSWKDRLMAGSQTDNEIVDTAGFLGELLARWHRETRGDRSVADAFNDYQTFVDLRVDPFHRRVASRFPEVASAINECVRDLLDVRECFVHGDFSPKNVLVGGDPPWVIDFEVAHYGNPIFDLAFMLCHLVLKSIHLAGRADALELAACEFVRKYGPTPPRLAYHTACILLARVAGVSPAGYLSGPERARVQELGLRILQTPDADLDSLWPPKIRAKA